MVDPKAFDAVLDCLSRTTQVLSSHKHPRWITIATSSPLDAAAMARIGIQLKDSGEHESPFDLTSEAFVPELGVDEGRAVRALRSVDEMANKVAQMKKRNKRKE